MQILLTKTSSSGEKGLKMISQPVSRSDSQSVGQSVSQSASQSVSQSVSQSASQSVSQSVSQPVSRSDSQSDSQSVSQSVSQSASQPVSQSASQPVSQSVSQSASQSASQPDNQLWKARWFVRGCRRAQFGFWVLSWEAWNLLKIESIRFLGYLSFRNIVFRSWHYFQKTDAVSRDGKRLARSSIVLLSDRLYLLSIWLW